MSCTPRRCGCKRRSRTRRFLALVWTGDAVGGGSAPAQELTGWAVAIEPGRLSVDELEEKLRLRAKPIVARIHRRQYLLCVRTIREEDFAEIAAAAAEAIR